MKHPTLGRDFSGFHWATLLPPNRPDVQDVNLVRGVLRQKAPKRVAVLGSTPELRLVCNGLDAGVSVFEISGDFYEHTTRLFRVSTAREELVEGHWLSTLPQYQGTYDVVLSDFTLGNVQLAEQTSLQKAICSLLAADGVLVDRVLHYRSGLSSTASILELAALPINIATANRFVCAALFRSPRVLEIGFVDVEECIRYAIDLDPSFAAIAEIVTTYLSPPGLSWSYTGRYVDPLVVYREELASLREIPTGYGGYEGAASVVVGRARQ